MSAFARRRGARVLLVIAALALAGAPVQASVTEPVAARDAAVPLVQNVTDWTRVASTAAPLAAPTPNAADGIGPGSMLLIHFGSDVYLCTANFLWGSGSSVYLGAAGHCFDPREQVTRVQVCVRNCGLDGWIGLIWGDFVDLGKVAFAKNAGIGDDFGVVEVPAESHSLLRATVPVWGGPSTATQGDGLTTGCLYGNGIVYGETFAGKARAGVVNYVGETDGFWEAAAMPASGGDSGSAVVVCDPGEQGLFERQPIGILTHGLFTQVGTVAWGTTVDRAAQIARDAGLTLELLTAVPGGDPTGNSAPDAQDDTAKTKVNRAVKVAVLANDSDPDGDPLTVSSVTSPSNGTATLNADGTITYAPARGFVGQDTFTYTVRDPSGLEDTASVVVDVIQNGGGGGGGGGKGGGKP